MAGLPEEIVPPSIPDSPPIEDEKESSTEDNSRIKLAVSSDKKRWTSSGTNHLLDLISSRIEEMDAPFVKKKQIYDDVSICLFEKGFPFTAKDVENKWGNLVRQYKIDCAKKEKSGETFTRTQFFDRMQDLLSHRHDISPVYTMGSNCAPKRKLQKPEKGDDCEDSDQCAKEAGTAKKQKKTSTADYKSLLLNKLDETLSYFKEFDKKLVAERAASQKKKEMEERKLSLLERLIDKK